MNKKKNINKQILIKLYNDFIIFYKFDILLAFVLLILVSITASTYPYLIQIIFEDDSIRIPHHHLRHIPESRGLYETQIPVIFNKLP